MIIELHNAVHKVVSYEPGSLFITSQPSKHTILLHSVLNQYYSFVHLLPLPLRQALHLRLSDIRAVVL